MIVVNDTPALVHNLDLVDGTHLRAGPEERDIFEQAKSFTFETDVKGGFGPGDLVLPRPDWWDPVDGSLLASLNTKDQDDRNVYEGRVTGTPKTGVNEIELQTEGWYKNTEDDPTASMIFRDMDLTHWGPASAQRKIDMGATWMVTDPGIIPDVTNGAPVLEQRHDGPWTSPPSLHMDAFYDAGAANRIGRMYANGRIIATIGASDVNWNVAVRLCSTDRPGNTGTYTQAAGGNPPGATFTVTMIATTNDRRFAEVAVYKGASDGAGGHSYGWTTLATYGLHGLTPRGTEPNAGFYVSDMAPYIISTWCPLINVTPDSFEPTSFIVPHADFRDPETTAATMLDKLALWGGNGNYPLDYGCYDNRTFYMKSPGTYGTQWRFRREEGADPKDQGSDAADRWNQAVVVYNPGDGTSKTIGPSGAGCDFETDLLRITDPDHVWNRIGQPHGKRFDVGVMNQLGAILFGQLALAEANLNQWRGSNDVKGDQITREGTQHPPYMIRGGDTNVVEDDMDVRERRITHTKYDEKKRMTTVDVGAKPDRFETMLARAGVAVTGLITS